MPAWKSSLPALLVTPKGKFHHLTVNCTTILIINDKNLTMLLVGYSMETPSFWFDFLFITSEPNHQYDKR
jgi:hypothetical protein